MPDLKWLRYGNWCGPGPYPPDNPPPKNAVDDCCKKHDLGYRQCGVIGLDAIKQSLPGSKNPCTIQYDKQFVDNLAKVDSETKGKEKMAGRIMRKYFNWKLQFDRPQPKLAFKQWLQNQIRITNLLHATKKPAKRRVFLLLYLHQIADAFCKAQARANIP